MSRQASLFHPKASDLVPCGIPGACGRRCQRTPRMSDAYIGKPGLYIVFLQPRVWVEEVPRCSCHMYLHYIPDALLAATMQYPFPFMQPQGLGHSCCRAGCMARLLAGCLIEPWRKGSCSRIASQGGVGQSDFRGVCVCVCLCVYLFVCLFLCGCVCVTSCLKS